MTAFHPENKRKKMSKDDDDDPLGWQTEWAKSLRKAKAKNPNADTPSLSNQPKVAFNHDDMMIHDDGKNECCSSILCVKGDSQDLATTIPSPVSPLDPTECNSQDNTIGADAAQRSNHLQCATPAPYPTSHHHRTISQQTQPAKLWVASSDGDELIDNKPKCPPCQRTKVATTQCRGGPPCKRCAARGWPESVCQSHELIPSEFLRIGRQFLRKGAPMKTIRTKAKITTSQSKNGQDKKVKE